jgi:hypothetical protein
MVNFFDALPILIQSAWFFFGTSPVLLVISGTSLVVKLILLALFTLRGIKSSRFSMQLILLSLMLVGGITEDFAWFAKLINIVFNHIINPKIPVFCARIAWGFVVIRYQALGLLIENLSEKKTTLKLHQYCFICISLLLFILPICLAFCYFNVTEKSILEISILKLASIYTLIPLACSSLIIALLKLRSANIPLLIKKQLKIFIQYLVIPSIAVDFIQVYPFNIASNFITKSPSFFGISTIILSFTVYYGARRVMGLRFLNLFEGKIKSSRNFDFMKDFKNVLEQFSHVTNEYELTPITQGFFKDAFDIPTRTIKLTLRDVDNSDYLEEKNKRPQSSDDTIVENFISAHDELRFGEAFLQTKKIIITDELDFSNFYEHDENYEHVLTFMNNIKADIFIPVFDKNNLVAYIIVERFARAQGTHTNAEFYSSAERDQMVVFATYLGNIIHLLRSRNLNALIAQEKELREELYDKHQKINQYKESIRSFMRTNKEKKIGIIFYKNRKFTFGNQTAQELVQVNLNTHEGHPITQSIKQTVQQTLDYKIQQTCFINDARGNKLVVSTIPHCEQNSVIITLYYPEISDLLKKKIELLSDPTKWDYLLYLETTKSGKLIDQLIPGNGETLLKFKIGLLKLALSKKALLLDMPQDDLFQTVELLHHISLRETLIALEPQHYTNSTDVAIKLFGVNPIFGMQQPLELPLLEKLDGNGTLFIHNINTLDLDTQEHLAKFLKYGIYQVLRSDQKRTSDVRVICSTNQDPQNLVRENKFSKALYEELNDTSLSMPSLLTLPENELENLAAGFGEQALKSDTFKNLLELTDKEKRRIAVTKPASLQELKTRVQQLLEKKSENAELEQNTLIDPSFAISDPDLAEAARLGKHALKDPKIMALLWNKFKNQNKIAAFLGVNRSSINRRCKEYKLL